MVPIHKKKNSKLITSAKKLLGMPTVDPVSTFGTLPIEITGTATPAAPSSGCVLYANTGTPVGMNVITPTYNYNINNVAAYFPINTFASYGEYLSSGWWTIVYDISSIPQLQNYLQNGYPPIPNALVGIKHSAFLQRTDTTLSDATFTLYVGVCSSTFPSPGTGDPMCTTGVQYTFAGEVSGGSTFINLASNFSYGNLSDLLNAPSIKYNYIYLVMVPDSPLVANIVSVASFIEVSIFQPTD